MPLLPITCHFHTFLCQMALVNISSIDFGPNKPTEFLYGLKDKQLHCLSLSETPTNLSICTLPRRTVRLRWGFSTFSKYQVIKIKDYRELKGHSLHLEIIDNSSQNGLFDGPHRSDT